MAEDQTLKRRGILAAAGAVMAGIVAKGTSQAVGATSGTGGQGNLVLGSNGLNSPNSATTLTLLETGNNFSASELFECDARAFTGTGTVNVVGVTGGGRGSAAGVVGILGSVASGFPVGLSSGVYGTASVGGSTKGVYGHHQSNGYGVYGDCGDGGYGVTGVATTAYGVLGQATSGFGVYGTSNTGVGVYGYSGGTGVYGYSTAGTGLYGVTNASNQYGVLGTTTAPNSTAMAGIANQDGCSAFSGGTTNPAAYAGVFQGNVVIQGRLVVSDPSYKSGALAHPDGSHRLVYCVESPESWIEDVGTGTLTAGKATVTFDKDFAAVVHTDTYHVFLTETDSTHHHLSVEKKSATGFTVTADTEIARLKGKQTADLSGTFSWKVMVKGKSAVKSERLGKFTMPKIPLPDPSKYKAPEVPAPLAKKP